MKKLLIATAIASTFFLPQAFAQTKNFEGFSVGLAVNAYSAKTDVTGTGAPAVSSESSSNASVKAGYGFGLGQSFVLGLGLSYDLGNIKAGNAPSVSTNVVGKDLITYSVEPGYTVSANTLVYAKLAYQTVSGKGEGVGSTNETFNFSGTAYGLGVRTMVSSNLSVGLEVQQSDFGSKTSSINGLSYKPSATMVSVGLGYKF